MKKLMTASLLAAAAMGGMAQDKPPARPKAVDAAAPVPPLVYESAFKGYRPLAGAEPGAWVEHNARVGRVGGWRAYAREAAAPASAASASGHKH